jgi:hypothetical protein
MRGFSNIGQGASVLEILHVICFVVVIKASSSSVSPFNRFARLVSIFSNSALTLMLHDGWFRTFYQSLTTLFRIL